MRELTDKQKKTIVEMVLTGKSHFDMQEQGYNSSYCRENFINSLIERLAEVKITSEDVKKHDFEKTSLSFEISFYLDKYYQSLIMTIRSEPSLKRDGLNYRHERQLIPLDHYQQTPFLMKIDYLQHQIRNLIIIFNEGYKDGAK